MAEFYGGIPSNVSRDRGESLERQLKLIQIFDERREVKVPEVARELGWTVRTVYRDLWVLQRIGVPIYQDRQGARSRWRVVEGYRRKFTVTLSWPEMVALTAGQNLLSGAAGSFFHEFAISGLNKIRTALPVELVKRADAMGKSVSASTGITWDGARARTLTLTLIEAIERCETVRILYRSREDAKPHERTVDPYHLHLDSGGTYLVGYSHDRKERRTFLLDRISEVNGTKSYFERTEVFRPGDFFQGYFGAWAGKPVEVRLTFARAVAGFVADRRLHPSQVNQLRSDGCLDVTLRVPLSPSLVRWVVGWGGQVEIHAPRPLAQQVARSHAKAANEDGPPGSTASGAIRAGSRLQGSARRTRARRP